MAMIRKRGDLQFQAVIRRKGWPAQRKTFNSQKEAEKWARAVEHEMDRGIFVSRYEAENTTLYEALERYAKEVSILKKSYARELVRIKNLQGKQFASRFLATLKGSDFASYRDQRRADGLAENTVRLDLALISHLFTIAQREWGMEGLSNPIKNIAMPSGSNERTRRLVGNEEELILNDLKNCRNPHILQATLFALETACRQSEVLRLTWKDVDFNQKTALINNTKNGESRTIPLSPRALSAITQLPRPIKNEAIFKVSANGLSRAFKRICKKRNLDNLKFHDLRHEATSKFFEKGLNPIEAAAITGHKTLQMLKRYTHLRPTDLAKKLGW